MKNILSLLTLLFVSSVVFAQNNVGIGTSNPRNSAILDLYSQNQGLLLPRVDTVNVVGIGALDHGLMVYDTTISKILIWNGTNWESVSGDNSLQSAYDGGQTINMSIGNIDFISSSANSVLFIDEANERLGIGTSTPSAGFKLDVVGGDIQINGLRMGRGTGGILNNLAIGANALNNNPTGGLNLAIGNTALQQTSSGGSNLAIGTGALIFNTTGSSNTIIGHDAMRAPAGSNENTGIGEGIMRNGVTGNANTAIGYYSLRNKTGNSNSALGHNTGITLTAGNNNTFLGANADAGVATLTNATAIGANTTVGASNALVLGNNANVGIGTSTPANKLEVIGDAAKFDSVIIVNGAQTGYVLTAADATGTASWQAVAGGVGGTGATDKLAYWTSANTLAFNTGLHYESASQRLGLGTAAPAEFLHVNSGNPITVASRFTNASTGSTGSDGFGFGITGTGNAFINNDEATPINISTASVTRMTIGSTGNIGIGTTVPTSRLEVNGDIRLSSGANRTIVMTPEPNSADPFSLTIKGSNSTIGAAARNGGHLVMEAGHNYNISIPTSTPGHVYLRSGGNIFGPGGNSPAGDIHLQTGGLAGNPNIYDERMIIKGSGNIGIGTSAPAAKLDLIGNIKITDGTQAFGRVLTSDANGLASWQPAASSPWTLNATDVFYTAGNVGIGTNAPNAPLQFSNALAPRKIVLFEGVNNDHQYFGFGVTGSELRYQINSPASHVFYASSSATTSTELMRVSSNGNVGIGTATPQDKLEINTPNSSIRMGAWSLFPNDYNMIDLKGSNGNDYNFLSGSSAQHLYINRPLAHNMYFRMNNVDQMVLDANGNLGIGTSSPTSKLDVSGTARVTGEAEINGTQFITTSSTNPVATDQFRINSGAMANVVFYTACASPSFAAVLFFDSNGQVEIMSEAGNGGNNVSLAAPNEIRLNDSCGQNVPYVFSLSGGVITVSYPLGAFTTAKWVITSI